MTKKEVTEAEEKARGKKFEESESVPKERQKLIPPVGEDCGHLKKKGKCTICRRKCIHGRAFDFCTKCAEGRYICQHGRVTYQCSECKEVFSSFKNIPRGFIMMVAYLPVTDGYSKGCAYVYKCIHDKDFNLCEE